MSAPHPETNPANPANPIISLEPSYHQVLNNRNAPSQPHNLHSYSAATYISNRSPMSEGNLGTPPPIKSISLPQKGHTAQFLELVSYNRTLHINNGASDGGGGIKGGKTGSQYAKERECTILGGSRRTASLNPVPILNSLPLSIRHFNAPQTPLLRPLPGSYPMTTASAS
jgi:hypothetical protein